MAQFTWLKPGVNEIEGPKEFDKLAVANYFLCKVINLAIVANAEYLVSRDHSTTNRADDYRPHSQCAMYVDSSPTFHPNDDSEVKGD